MFSFCGTYPTRNDLERDTDPVVGTRAPIKARIMDVLPDPFGPTIVMISPRLTVKSTSRKTILLSYPMVTEFSDIKSVI
jgi:hypothetical protein